MRKYVVLLAAMLMLGAVARGQYVNYGDSNYMFNRLDTFPPFLSSGNSCLQAYSDAREIRPERTYQIGSMFSSDSVQHICGVALLADTMIGSYLGQRRDQSVCGMLYLYHVPQGISDFTLLDSVVVDVTMPYWRKMILCGIDTLCPNLLTIDTIPVYERLFSHEYIIPAGDSVLVTYTGLPSPKDHPSLHYSDAMDTYNQQIWDPTPDLRYRTVTEGVLNCYTWGLPGPVFPIRHRECPRVEGVRVDTVDGTTVCISWHPEGDADYYLVEYGPEGFQYGGGAYSEGVVADSVYDTAFCVSGLGQDTVYAFFVSACCHKTMQYGMPDSVRVLTNDNAECAVPSRFRLRNTTDTSAVVEWDTVGEQRRFEMLVKMAGDTAERRFEPDSNPYELRGLVPGAVYSVWLRAQCHHQCAVHDTVVWGPWKGPVQFRIGREGIDNVREGGLRFAVVPNPAHGTVTVETEGVAARGGGAVTVTDAVGKTVLRAAVVSDRQQLDIADLPAGTYFVTLATKEGTSTRKLVVE